MRIPNMLLKLKNMNLVDFYIFKNISYNRPFAYRVRVTEIRAFFVKGFLVEMDN